MSGAELAARRTSAAAVLADYRRELRSAPLSRPPGREWMLRLAAELESLLDALGDAAPIPPSGGNPGTWNVMIHSGDETVSYIIRADDEIAAAAAAGAQHGGPVDGADVEPWTAP